MPPHIDAIDLTSKPSRTFRLHDKFSRPCYNPSMSAPEGNIFATKFPTPESRKKLCAAYIAHVESGLSDECFPECDPQTLRKYIAECSDDFDADKIEVSRRKRQLFWEVMGRDGAMS